MAAVWSLIPHSMVLQQVSGRVLRHHRHVMLPRARSAAFGGASTHAFDRQRRRRDYCQSAEFQFAQSRFTWVSLVRIPISRPREITLRPPRSGSWLIKRVTTCCLSDSPTVCLATTTCTRYSKNVRDRLNRWGAQREPKLAGSKRRETHSDS